MIRKEYTPNGDDSSDDQDDYEPDDDQDFEALVGIFFLGAVGLDLFGVWNGA